MKKLTANELRSMIIQEVTNSQRPMRSTPLVSLLFEQEEATAEEAAIEGLPTEFQNPQMTAFSGNDNITKIDATELVAQLASGDPEAPVYAAIAAFHNPEQGRFALDFESGAGTVTVVWQVDGEGELTLEGDARQRFNNLGEVIESLGATLSVEASPVFLVP